MPKLYACVASKDFIKFKVDTRARNAVLIAVQTLFSVLTAGIIFGYVALLPILKDAGAFHELCDDGTPLADICDAQTVRLNLMFTIASSIAPAAALVTGPILDSIGPKMTIMLGATVSCTGALLYAYGYFMAGAQFLALGGPFVFIAGFPLTALYPNAMGLIFALFSCAFDVSSIVPTGLLALHTSCGYNAQALFLGYAVYCAVVFVTGMVAWPWAPPSTDQPKPDGGSPDLRKPLLKETSVANVYAPAHSASAPDVSSHRQGPFQTLLDGPHDAEAGMQRGMSLGTGAAGGQRRESSAMLPMSMASKPAVKYDPSTLPLTQQLETPFFWLMSAFAAILALNINTYIGTVMDQLEYAASRSSSASEHDADMIEHKYGHPFDLILPLGGVVAAFPIGYCLDHIGLAETTWLTWGLAAVHALLNTVKLAAPLETQYATMVILAFLRGFKWSLLAANAGRFGHENLGKVYGFASGMTGIFGLLQYAATYVGVTVSHGDFLWVNVFLCATVLVSVAHPLYVTRAFGWRST